LTPHEIETYDENSVVKSMVVGRSQPLTDLQRSRNKNIIPCG
jgi:hypothetical protein